MKTANRWGRRRITPTKAQRALDALMALVQTCDWSTLDHGDQVAIDNTCEVLTRLRDNPSGETP